MPYFKDTQNKIHFLDNKNDKNLLPLGSIEISELDATKLLAPTPDEVKAASNNAIYAQLNDFDAASIRAIREYISKQADAPQLIIDKETQAAAARSKLI